MSRFPGRKIAEARGEEEIGEMFRAMQRAQWRRRVAPAILALGLSIFITGVLMVAGILPLWIPLTLCIALIALCWYDPYRERTKTTRHTF